MARALECAHDALLLQRVDLGEERRLGRNMPERLVVELRQRVTCEHRRRVESDGRRKVSRHEAVVPGNDLDLDVQLRQVAEDARRVGLGRVEEEQEAGEHHLALVVALIGSLGRHGTTREREDTESRFAFRFVIGGQL